MVLQALTVEPYKMLYVMLELKKVFLIEEPVAAAIGAGMPVDEPVANVVVDFGGGSTEVAIISFGGVVACHTVKVGGDHLDDDIIQFVRKKYNVMIGERTAENIKIEIGYALVDHEEMIWKQEDEILSQAYRRPSPFLHMILEMLLKSPYYKF